MTSVWRTRRGVGIAVALRLGLGALLVVAAPSCRLPEVVRILGVVSLLSGALIPLIGFRRLRALIDWWASRPEHFIRGWSLVAAGFGAFLAYAGT